MIYNLQDINISFIVNNKIIENGEFTYSTIPSPEDWATANADDNKKLIIKYVDSKEIIYAFYLYINTDTKDYEYLQSLVDKQFLKENKPEFIRLVFETKKLKAIVNKAYFRNLVQIKRDELSNKNEAKFIIDTVKGEVELIEKVDIENTKEINTEKERLE